MTGKVVPAFAAESAASFSHAVIKQTFRRTVAWAKRTGQCNCSLPEAVGAGQTAARGGLSVRTPAR